MDLKIFFPLVVAILDFLTVPYVLALDSRNRDNRAFCWFSGIIGFWVLGCYIFYLPMDDRVFMVLAPAYYLVWGFLGFALLHFIYTYLNRKKDAAYYGTLLLAIMAVCVSIFTDLVVAGFDLHHWGISLRKGPLYNAVTLLNYLVPTILSLFFLFRSAAQSGDHLLYRQRRMIMLGLVVTGVYLALHEYCSAALFGTVAYERLSPLGTVILTLFMFVAIVRYRLLAPSLTDVAHDLFAFLDDGVVILDRSNRVLHLNPAARALLGVGERFTGRLLLEDIIPHFDCNGEYRDRETVIRGYGVERQALVNLSGIGIDNFSAGRILIIQDITERKRMLEELRRSVQKYRALVENITDIIYTINGEGIITYISPAVTVTGGFEPAEIIGSTFERFVHPDDIPEVRYRFGRTLAGELIPFEHRLLTKDGRSVWVLSNSKTMPRSDGSIEVHGIFTNIDNLRATRDELTMREQQYGVITRQLTDNIWIIDLADLRMEFSTPSVASVSGWTREEALGMPVKEWIDRKSLRRAAQIVREEIEHDAERDPGRTFIIELLERHKDGRQIIVEATVRFLRDETGKPSQLLGVSRDITERKNLELELQKSLRELRERNEIIESDLRTARIIQQALFPATPPQHARLRFDFRHLPVDAIGGDYIAFVPLGGGGMGIFMADVAGHGVSAALCVSLIKSVSTVVGAEHGEDPVAFMAGLDRDMARGRGSLSVSALYGVAVVRGEETVFSFSSAGYPAPLLARRGDERVTAYGKRGPAMGAGNETAFPLEGIAFGPGDRLFLCSDALLDTKNPGGTPFGHERLERLLLDTRPALLSEALDTIMSALREFSAGRGIADDVVVIGVEMRE